MTSSYKALWCRSGYYISPTILLSLSILCCMQETVLSGFECNIVVNLCWPGSGRLSCIHNKVHSILLCGAAVLFPLRILDRVDKLGKILLIILKILSILYCSLVI